MPPKTNHRGDIYNTDIAIQVRRKDACTKVSLYNIDT